MKIVLDMNLSPAWVEVLERSGFEAFHWKDIGDARAPDREILSWAARNEAVVFTNDLDFSRILALGGASGPSVIQIRGEDLLPETMAAPLIAVLQAHGPALEQGALVVLDENTMRVRTLPL